MRLEPDERKLFQRKLHETAMIAAFTILLASVAGVLDGGLLALGVAAVVVFVSWLFGASDPRAMAATAGYAAFAVGALVVFLAKLARAWHAADEKGKSS